MNHSNRKYSPFGELAAAPLCIKTSRLSEIAALILFHVKTGVRAAPDEAQG